MARVTGFTAERMLEIEGTTIIGGTINDGGHLILSRRDGFTIDAGEVKGTKGDPGSGVYDVEITYQAGNSGTVEPTGEWTTNVPIVHVGQYLWVKTLTTYADPDNPDVSFTTTTFTVTRQPENGSDGQGITGQTIQYQEGNSGVTAPTGDWLGSVPPVAPGKFLWTRTITTYTDSSTNTAYSVAKQGSDGTAGEDGSDGLTPYLHVAYANSADGVEDFSTTDPSGRSYMGTATTFTEPDPTDPSVYGWSLIRGASGTGISSSSVRYQASTSGTIAPVGTWLVEVPQVPEGEFLWSRSITNFTDGASQTVYSVSKQGERGQDGSDGRGITSIVEEYYLSNSATTLTGGTWSTTRPDWVSGKYFWTRSTINYTSGNPTTTDPICVSGESGSSGSDGRSIVDVDVYYYLSNSSTSLIGGSWSTTAPVWADGKYMWSKTVTTYSEGDPTESSPVCITGSAGQKGDAGKGVSGTIVHYAVGTSGTSEPTTGWTSSVPNVPAGQFLWTRTTTQYTEGPDTVAYSVGKMGEQGPQGDPKYTWIMYADDQNGSGISHSPVGKTYIGVSANRNSPTESENALDYAWSLIKGADGSDGSDGTDGRGILSTTVSYQSHTSGTTAPTGTWSSTVPSVTPGNFLWTRTVVVYTSGSPETTTSYSVARMGQNGSDGTDGNDGLDGRGITGAVTTYQVSSSGTTIPTGTWVTNPPATTAGQYFWTRIVTSYTSGPDNVSYAVARHGATGSTGAQGLSVSSVTPYYWLGTSQPSVPTVLTPPSPWSTTEPTYTPGTTNNLYVVVRTVFSNNTFSYTPVSLSASFATSKAAHNLASTAMTTADGKNKVVRSTGNAASPGSYQAGDQWWKFSGSQVIQFWLHSGSAWVSQTLTDSVITNLHAATVTAGTFSGDRYAANSIESTKLLISGANMVPNSDLEVITGWVPVGSTPVLTNTTRGRAAYLPRTASTSDRTFTSQEFRVAGSGVVYAISATVLAQSASGATPCRIEIIPVNTSGTELTPVVVATSAADGQWRNLRGQYTTPNGSNIRGLKFRFVGGATTATTAFDYLVQPRVVEAAVGEMIVDGSIDADHLSVDALDFKTAMGMELYGSHIQGGVIEQVTEALALGNHIEPITTESVGWLNPYAPSTITLVTTTPPSSQSTRSVQAVTPLSAGSEVLGDIIPSKYSGTKVKVSFMIRSTRAITAQVGIGVNYNQTPIPANVWTRAGNIDPTLITSGQSATLVYDVTAQTTVLVSEPIYEVVESFTLKSRMSTDEGFPGLTFWENDKFVGRVSPGQYTLQQDIVDDWTHLNTVSRDQAILRPNHIDFKRWDVHEGGGVTEGIAQATIETNGFINLMSTQASPMHTSLRLGGGFDLYTSGGSFLGIGVSTKLETARFRSNRVLQPLWEGSQYMNSSQTAFLSELVSDQLNGIILEWSRYPSGGPAADDSFTQSFISKTHAYARSGRGIYVHGSTSHTNRWSKYLYISDDKVVGHANNAVSPNNLVVLRRVIGV